MESNNISSQEKSQTWADLLKILAIIGVIFMHAGSVLFSKSITTEKYDWFTGMFYASLGAFSVPVFLMLSGAFLLNSRDDLKTFFSKRIKKVVVPFIFWIIIYAFFVKYYLKIDIEIFSWVFFSFISGPVFYHLWYMFLIIGLYLVMPILRTWITHATKAEIHYFLALWIITVSIIPLIKLFYPIHIAVSLIFISQHIGYLVLGYYLKEKKVSLKGGLLCVLIFCVSVSLSAWASYKYSLATGSNSDFFVEKMSIVTLISSISIFLFIKSLTTYSFFGNEKIRLIIKNGGGLSFGIYLLHAIILIWVMDGSLGYKLTVDFIHPVIGVPLVVLATYVISAFIIFILKTSKVLKFLVP